MINDPFSTRFNDEVSWAFRIFDIDNSGSIAVEEINDSVQVAFVVWAAPVGFDYMWSCYLKGSLEDSGWCWRCNWRNCWRNLGFPLRAAQQASGGGRGESSCPFNFSILFSPFPPYFRWMKLTSSTFVPRWVNWRNKLLFHFSSGSSFGWLCSEDFQSNDTHLELPLWALVNGYNQPLRRYLYLSTFQECSFNRPSLQKVHLSVYGVTFSL